MEIHPALVLYTHLKM